MTPAARVAAAIDILDEVLAGKPVEQALTGWARHSRFAGSKDRAAVRDHVFDAVRARRSLAALGGGETGRGLMLGACRRDGTDPDLLFSGVAYGPPALTPEERAAGRDPEPGAEALDIADWLWPAFRDSLGDSNEAAARALQTRAPVHLRVNLGKGGVDGAVAALAEEGIETRPHPAADTALEVVTGARRIRNSVAYRDGLVELQDAASQAVVAALPLTDGMRVLDYCAGGGGKTLAIGARAEVALFAHDALPHRMQDLPERAARAGLKVDILEPEDLEGAAPFDLVLCDVPCSGSGAWRRAPEGKWRLTPQALDEVIQTQAEILDRAATLVAPGGVLAYATCSVLARENGDQIAAFLARHSGWHNSWQHAWSVVAGTDGFFSAQLTRDPTPS
ncbi:RsmB/NOP family class I SAM-dependent RNA methyltransferase [Antarcticimicrobium sediminis]|uniref:RsmB/NOP family class I SAM-dependent RNA methyltransferase n=1 Tax=Antarcticimicrobium sediminis TaxID=2546227 RepID=A0A4R5EKV6_9RHOB|nr:RsmB/NOP family class I SAM-dependent RNA methyltransferase [Antarcticimicrobium sediminis]TDE35259.1 RsmB/NOP family class I SAM-dependent RNA methyltransferase [Antarcticimicrobium sediminis]